MKSYKIAALGLLALVAAAFFGRLYVPGDGFDLFDDRLEIVGEYLDAAGRQ